jgi:hypothetical protein
MPRTRSSPFDTQIRCRVCGGNHIVRGVAELLRQPISFGGGAQGETSVTTAGWAGPVTCPREQRSFEGELLIPAEYNESVRRVQIESVTDEGADKGRPPAPPTEAGPPAHALAVQAGGDWIDEELRDWRKTTVSTQRTYATTMLTTSSGAVAVYFAVLKYLGWEEANFGTPLVFLTILPPVLLFSAAASFALALRPSLTFVERSEYAEFRARRVDQMHRRATAGTALYGAALLMAIVIFAVVLEAPQ